MNTFDVIATAPTVPLPPRLPVSPTPQRNSGKSANTLRPMIFLAGPANIDLIVRDEPAGRKTRT